MKEGTVVAISLAAVAVVLLVVLLGWRAKRHGVTAFWARIERAGWLASIASMALAVALPLLVKDDKPAAQSAHSAPATSANPPATSSNPLVPVQEATAPLYADQPITLAPRSCDVYQPSIDFDEPVTYENYAVDAAYKTADLWYETCIGSFQQRAGAFIGNAAETLPSAKDCATSAKTRPIGELDIRDVKVGQAFCVVTSDRQVAWAKVTRKGAPFDETLNHGSIPTIDFLVTLWPEQ
jgi:hypothetical protein